MGSYMFCNLLRSFGLPYAVLLEQNKLTVPTVGR